MDKKRILKRRHVRADKEKTEKGAVIKDNVKV